jgi:hypothetical protein
MTFIQIIIVSHSEHERCLTEYICFMLGCGLCLRMPNDIVYLLYYFILYIHVHCILSEVISHVQTAL